MQGVGSEEQSKMAPRFLIVEKGEREVDLNGKIIRSGMVVRV